MLMGGYFTKNKLTLDDLYAGIENDEGDED